MKKKMKKISKIIVVFTIVIAMVLTYFSSLVNVVAATYGEGDKQINVEIIDNGFDVDHVTINDSPWSGTEDVYKTSDGIFVIKIWVLKKGDEYPDIMYCGGECGSHFNKSVEVAGNGNELIYTITANNPDGNFVPLEIVGGPPPGGDNHDEHFDGRAVVLWSCGNNDENVCYHEFGVVDPQNCNPENPTEACDPEIGNFDDGNSTFFKDTEIEADNRPGEKFNVGAEYREWYLTDEFYRWQDLYRLANGMEPNAEIDWDTLDPRLIMGDPKQPNEIGEIAAALEADNYECGEEQSQESCLNEYAAKERGEIWTHELQPVGEPDAKNAYVSYGDRNFKVVIFNDNYRGVTTGDLTGLTYYPARWVNPYLRTDQYDISDTTEDRPAPLESILLESTININALEWNGFEIASITPLDVPADAVTVTPTGDKFSIVFSSHFYDNVVFRITDTDNENYYVKIKRATIDAWIDHDESGDFLRADFYYAKTKSYADFDITGKIVYKDGSTKLVTLTPRANVDDGLGNFTDKYYIDQEYPDSHMDPEHDEPMGKGLKLSTFAFNLEDGERDTIQDIYMNAEYKGNDPDVYPGAYSGSGEGTLANIYHPEEEEH